MICGIVILNYNDYKTTKNLLNLIKNYHSIEKIIVVDNCSTDDSFEKLKVYESDKIKVLQSLRNEGYSKGNNIGARYLAENTDVDVICISNPDVKFGEKFVTTILSDFEKKEDYSIITGLQVNSNGEIASNPFWEEYSTLRWFVRRIRGLSLVRRIYGTPFDKKYVKNKLSSKCNFFQVGAVEGSLFFIRADDFQKMDFFDEGIQFYYEEDILAKKVKRLEKKIGIDRRVSYIHYGASTTQKVFNNKTKIKHNFHSPIYYFNYYQSSNKFLQGLNYAIGVFSVCESYMGLFLRPVVAKAIGKIKKSILTKKEGGWIKQSKLTKIHTLR